jgi:hypothetical protein
VLREFGLDLPEGVEVRVWDSTAEVRYLVLPERPAGTDHLSEEALAALVTRDSMIGVTKVLRRRLEAAHEWRPRHGRHAWHGAVVHEKDEPVFHEEWEGRVYALTRLVRAGGGRWNIDAGRYEIERIAPAEYLRMSYYERWAWRLRFRSSRWAWSRRRKSRVDRLLRVREGDAAADAQPGPAMVATRVSTKRDVDVKATFKRGSVCVPVTCIRPVIRACRATRAAKSGQSPRIAVCSCFRHQRGIPGRETSAPLFGPFHRTRTVGRSRLTARSVYLDLWDDYLERV